MSGVVIDAKGSPVPGSQMAYTGMRGLVKTDSEGRFFVDTEALLVIRKAGYQSVRLNVPLGEPARVTLRPTVKGLPDCSSKSSCDLLPGESLCFPSAAA